MSTIITKRQFPNYHKYEMELAGRPLTMEVGKLAELANAAVMVGYGDTRVLCCVTAAPRPRDGIDFFPLSVDFEEKLYSVGRIPGSFMRREGQPLCPPCMASRVIDRSIRPLFPYDFRNDVVVTATVMSVDRDCSPEVTAMIGVSACLAYSCIPWNGPVGCPGGGLCGRQDVSQPRQRAASTPPARSDRGRHRQEGDHDRGRRQGAARRHHVRRHQWPPTRTSRSRWPASTRSWPRSAGTR